MVDNVNPNIKYPPIAVLASEAHPTLISGIKDGPQSVNGFDFQSGPKAPGDGRLPFQFATPPPGIPYKLYKTKKAHMDLLNLKKVPNILADLIAEQENTAKL